MSGIDKTQLELISSIVYRKFGIYLGEDKYDRLEFKLGTMMNRGYCTDTEDLCERLSAGDPLCFEQLANCVTTCHTFFFREPEHFQVLISDIKKYHKAGTLIWCAACSTGEEPYSIIMALLDAGITDFHIVASDVNREVLVEFNRGIYHESKLAQMPSVLRERYFTSEDDGYYRIDESLRKYLSIKNLNLMNRIQFPRPFDYVFCRNVFIYFDEKSRAAALNAATSNMKTGSLLFIGHAEVLLSQPDNLKKTGCSVYCRTD